MRISTLICILFIASLSVSGNEPPGLNGIVVKPDGSPMESALIVIHDYQEPNRGYVSDT